MSECKHLRVNVHEYIFEGGYQARCEACDARGPRADSQDEAVRGFESEHHDGYTVKITKPN